MPPPDERGAEADAANRPIPDSRNWIAAHIHFDGIAHGIDGDAVVVELVEPLAEMLMASDYITMWFFIRYAEDGPHIRFRMRLSAMGHVHEVRQRLAVACAAFSARQPMSPVSVRWKSYDAEVDRYGGSAGLLLAEEMFHRSSVLAASVLANGHVRIRHDRLGPALVATLVVAYAFLTSRQQVRDMLAAYAKWFIQLSAKGNSSAGTELLMQQFVDGFERQSHALGVQLHPVITALEHGAALSPHWDAFRVHLTAAATEFHSLCSAKSMYVRGVAQPAHIALRAMVPNYVHMTLNRLGVSNVEEAYVAELLCRTLAA